MRVDENAPIQNACQGLEPKVAPRRHRVFAARPSRFIGPTLGLVFLRARKARSQRELDSHPRRGIAAGYAVGTCTVRLFWILAECELHSRRSALEKKRSATSFPQRSLMTAF